MKIIINSLVSYRISFGSIHLESINSFFASVQKETIAQPTKSSIIGDRTEMKLKTDKKV